MTASTAPTQPPDKCPACLSGIVSDSGTGVIEFECRNTAINTGSGYKFGQSCPRAFSAAIALRAERDAALARLAELQAALLKFGRHDYTCVTTNYDHPEALGVKCDCGLGEMLSDAPAIDYAHEQEFDSWEPGNVERETE